MEIHSTAVPSELNMKLWRVNISSGTVIRFSAGISAVARVKLILSQEIETTWVFIEVKYRRDEHEGDPAEAVDARKQARILRTARYYMTHYHISEDTPCRFDVVAVLGSNVRLIRDAFWCG